MPPNPPCSGSNWELLLLFVRAELTFQVHDVAQEITRRVQHALEYDLRCTQPVPTALRPDYPPP